MESLGGDVKSPYFISSVEPGVGRELDVLGAQVRLTHVCHIR